jgi:hypothetical protein
MHLILGFLLIRKKIIKSVSANLSPIFVDIIRYAALIKNSIEISIRIYFSILYNLSKNGW